jgi:NTE family protein
MKALVLSGGGNLGAAQVGALRVLAERGIIPDMIVGCSVGALNASFIAREVSADQVEILADVWRSISRSDIYPGNRLGAIWRFISGKDSLYYNRRFFDFLQRGGVSPAVTFSDYLPLKVYITATQMPAGKLHVFGDNPHDRLLDALMASTALPPMHPPWTVDGEQ